MNTFAGFGRPTYTQTPDEIFDELMPDLSGAELKVLLYIVRRTFGFGRQSCQITLDDMLNGRRGADGRVFDRGTGISSRGTVVAALRSLREAGVILADGPKGRAKAYCLRFQDSCPIFGQQPELIPNSAGPKIEPPAGPVIGLSQDRKSDPNKTNSLRQTDRQTEKNPPASPSGVRTSKSDTWLTPYYDAWRERFRTNMKPGRHVAGLAKARAELGDDEAIRRWKIYLTASGSWANGGHFADTLGDWDRAPGRQSQRRSATADPAHPDHQPAGGDKYAGDRALQAEQEGRHDLS